MTDTSTLSDIATGRPVETALLEKASADCPYFAAPLLASLRAETDPEARRRLKMKLAALVGNRKVLAVLFGEEPEEFLAFYPDEIRPSLSTDDTISSFLERYGDTTESQAEGDVIPIEAPAMDYAAATLSGAAEMYLSTHTHPGALKDAVCSPGGSTIAGIRVLEQRGFRSAAMDCVTAAYEKNKELGKS